MYLLLRIDPDYLITHSAAMGFWYAVASVTAIGIGVSSWIFAIRMRRRIKMDLGNAARNSDLSSIETWMKVDEVEQKKNPGAEWAPESLISDYQPSKQDL